MSLKLNINGSSLDIGINNVDFLPVTKVIDVHEINVISGIDLYGKGYVYKCAGIVNPGLYKSHGKVSFKFLVTTELTESETITIEQLITSLGIGSLMNPTNYYKLIYYYAMETTETAHEQGWSLSCKTIRPSINVNYGYNIIYEHITPNDHICKYSILSSNSVMTEVYKWTNVNDTPILHHSDSSVSCPVGENSYIMGTLEW